MFTDKVLISDKPEDIESSDAIILPGDGAFGAGMAGLKSKKLLTPVKDFIGSGKPVLGICLGAQILMTKGFEFGDFDGLGVIPGKVVRFSNLKKGTKIPQIGWNTIKPMAEARSRILAGLPAKPYFYFVHSFIIEPGDRKYVLAISNYGGKKFCSVVGKNNIIGCQFHPEKSGEAGLKIIENFVKLTKY